MSFYLKKIVFVAASFVLCGVNSLAAPVSDEMKATIRASQEAARKRSQEYAREQAGWERANQGAYEGGSASDALRAAFYFQGKAAEAERNGAESNVRYYTGLANDCFEIAEKNLEYSKRDGNTYDIEKYNQLLRSLEPETSSNLLPVFITIVILSAAGCGVYYYIRRRKNSNTCQKQSQNLSADEGSTTPAETLPNNSTDIKQYYICKPGGSQEGPYPEEMVRTCFEQGVFPADTLIWYEGASEWMPIQSIFVATQAEPAPAVPPPFQAPPPPQEEAVYYVAQPGMQPQGPYTKSTVLTDYYKGTYPAGSMVWGPDTGTWIPIENLLGSALHSGVKSAVGHFQGRANTKSWNPITAFVSCMKRYAQFSGRASRSEYWFFQLAWFILYIPIVIAKAVLAECDAEGVGLLLELIFRFATLVPISAVAVRRCHDTGRSGWFMLIPIYGWVLFFLPSKNENNPYGSSPLPPA